MGKLVDAIVVKNEMKSAWKDDPNFIEVRVDIEDAGPVVVLRLKSSGTNARTVLDNGTIVETQHVIDSLSGDDK